MYEPWTRSVYAITVGGNNVTDRWMAWLIDLQTVDKAGSISDTCSIGLDDVNGQIQLPVKGDPILINLGSTTRGVAQVFEGHVDTVRSTGSRGGGRVVTVTGKGFDTTSAVKDPKQKHWDNASVSTVLGDAAKAAGLSGVTVHSSLASITRPYWAQDGESILAFGKRLADQLGATFKVVGSQGIFVPKNAGVSASGKSLSPVACIVGENVIDWDIAPDTGRPVYSRVRARWYDKAAAKWMTEDIEVEGGSSGGKTTTQHVTHPRPDSGEASKAAGAEKSDQEAEKGGGRITITGDPTVFAEAPVTVSGAREGIDGQYVAETVTHSLNRSRGFITTIDLKAPKEGG